MVKKNNGRIIKGVGGIYTIVPNFESDVRIYAKAKGTFRHDKITPMVGDIVAFEYIDENNGIITDIFPRKNLLIRPACSNVDCLVITATAQKPKADLYMLDKLSAVAVYNNIDILFVFNKCDISPAEELLNIYTKAGFKAIMISAQNSTFESPEICKIKDFIKGKISFFAGASGVGKTSIMNLLFPDLSLITGGLSKKISRGKHTTRATELYQTSDGAFIADTPGFSNFEVAQLKLIPLERLPIAFPDIYENTHGCIYSDCTHTREGSDVCTVKQAVECGKISLSRHESFIKLYDEISAVKPWN